MDPGQPCLPPDTAVAVTVPGPCGLSAATMVPGPLGPTLVDPGLPPAEAAAAMAPGFFALLS